MATPTEQKLISSLIGALLFILLSLPFMYEITNVIGKAIKLPFTDANGPTIAGIVFHGVVFFALTVGIMFLAEKLAARKH